jgi:Predicted soluble lytic transglycosylase fused to an ABC-type amino acid-binding protein
MVQKPKAPKNKLMGFMNHSWNGVTTTAFAKLALGLFNAGHNKPIRHHWTPRDKVSKYELLQIFEKELGSKTQVVPHQNSKDIDRTLSTSNPDLNEKLWKLAGYDQIPSIAELCQQFISIDKKLGLGRD